MPRTGWGVGNDLHQRRAVFRTSVAQAAVVYKPGARGFKHLVAYVCGAGVPDEAEVRQRLRDTLPSYMIPQRFQFPAELPRNASGKVDRRSLAQTED